MTENSGRGAGDTRAINEKLAEFDRRAIELENEAAGISLAAMTGDAAARKGLMRSTVSDRLMSSRAETSSRPFERKRRQSLQLSATRRWRRLGRRPSAALVIADRLLNARRKSTRRLRPPEKRCWPET